MKQPECIVYLEAYEKVGNGIVDAYIDFRQMKDMVLFGWVVNFENNKATFIELRSLKSSKRLRRGCYYKLNLDVLKNYPIERRDDSLLIGASYDLKDMQMPDGNDSAGTGRVRPRKGERVNDWRACVGCTSSWWGL